MTIQNGYSIAVGSLPVGWNGLGPNDACNYAQLFHLQELNPKANLGFALGG